MESRYSGCRSSHSRRRFWTRICAEWAGDLGGRGCGLAYAVPEVGDGGFPSVASAIGTSGSSGLIFRWYQVQRGRIVVVNKEKNKKK